MAMTLPLSTIIAIAYFSIYSTFTIMLAIIVYHTGKYESIKEKSFWKDLWSQKGIYGSVLVYFYDTATDLGVVINWYILMKAERNGEYDYISVDMTVFFWCNISFMLLYRIVMVFGTLLIIEDSRHEHNAAPWWTTILALTETYIFYAVSKSFKNAQQKATSKQTKQTQTHTIEKEMEHIDEKSQSTASKEQNNIIRTIQPSEEQQMTQFLESFLESLPQVMLQIIFFVRSANDEQLRKAGTNDLLIVLSIIASLFSITNKFASLLQDREEKMVGIIGNAQSLDLRDEFPNCMNYWFICLMFWGLANLICRVVIFAMVWAVMGGIILAIYVASICAFWCCIGVFEKQLLGIYDTGSDALLNCLLIGIIKPGSPILHHIFQYIESAVGLSLITFYASTNNTCSICEDPENRHWKTNQRILVFMVMGWTSLALECITFVVLRANKIVKDATYDQF
eukprot:535241_1